MTITDEFKRITKNKNYTISPVSESDIAITAMLVDILQSIGYAGLAEILGNYKNIADHDLIDDLLEYNAKEDNLEDKNKTIKKPKSISLKDTSQITLLSSLVLGFSKITANYEGLDKPGIQLNPYDVNSFKMPMYANQVLLYADEDTRDKDAKRLKQIMRL